MENNMEKSFPFDSEMVNGKYDREYVADDFARYFRAFISSGLFLAEKTNLQVLTNGDMTVTLHPGKAIIDGYRYELVKDVIINISPADGLLDRIDRIAITWSQEDRDIHYTIREGEFSYEPVAPECRRSAEYKDYVVADIYVAANKISITQSAITDQRLNSEICGLAAPFMTIDTKLIFDQLQAFYEETVAANGVWTSQEKNKFEEWFELIRNQLSEDAAGNLQNQLGNPDFDDTGEVEGIESFTGFMESFVKGTGVFQLLARLKTGLKYVLHRGQLVNNGTCNEPGKYPLDAAYGKDLQDQIDNINNYTFSVSGTTLTIRKE